MSNAAGHWMAQDRGAFEEQAEAPVAMPVAEKRYPLADRISAEERAELFILRQRLPAFSLQIVAQQA